LETMFYKLFGMLTFGAAVFGISYHYNKRFVDWLRFQSVGTRDYVTERLGMMFIEIPTQRISTGMMLLSFGSGAMVFVLFLPNLVPAFMFGALAIIGGWKAPRPIVDWLYRRRCKKFVKQMIDALSLMS